MIMVIVVQALSHSREGADGVDAYNARSFSIFKCGYIGGSSTSVIGLGRWGVGCRWYCIIIWVLRLSSILSKALADCLCWFSSLLVRLSSTHSDNPGPALQHPFLLQQYKIPMAVRMMMRYNAPPDKWSTRWSTRTLTRPVLESPTSLSVMADSVVVVFVGVPSTG